MRNSENLATFTQTLKKRAEDMVGSKDGKEATENIISNN